MATLIRLKQLESGSYLNTAATIGQDFSQSVVDIISNQVVAVLPDGVVSSSIQVDLLQTTNFGGFNSSISTSFQDIYGQLANITGSLEIGLSASAALSLSQSNAIFNEFTQSADARLSNLELFSSSLDNGFATDAELALTSSQILDQGEW